MNIAEPFIDRPVATTLLMVGAVLLGLLGYRTLPVSALPAVDFPTIQVQTELPGASPDTIAGTVTAPLERQLGHIPSLASIVSVSSYGSAVITLQFTLDRNIDAAAQDVQAAISAAGGQLPRLLPNPPTYNKVNPADAPVLILSVTSDSLPIARVQDVAGTILAQKLSQIDGVGLVAIWGGQRPAVRIQADPQALAGLGLTLEDVRTALVAASVNQPKGDLSGSRQSYQIGANDQIESAAPYQSIIIAYRNGAPVRLGDVAVALDDVDNAKLAAWHNDAPAVILNIQRQPGANIIETVDRLQAVLPQLKLALPPAVKVAIVSDRTQTIRASIADVQFTLVLTVALVVLVIFVFLRRLWATVIPSVALPLSLIATLGVLQLAGFSLNNLSLMALTVAAGFVVDDAIVMIENITRFREAGMAPREAAVAGSRQIGFTIVSLTVSLVAVFIPLLFMGGIVGRLFHEFAITLSIAVIISALVSLTLTPMMCAKLLGRRERESRLMALSERGFDWLRDRYENGLDWVLAHQRTTLIATVATVLVTALLYAVIPKGFLPAQDTGLLIGVTEAPQDISFAAMVERQTALAAALRRDPAVASVASLVGAGPINATGNAGRLSIVLQPKAVRHASVSAIVERLKAIAHAQSGLSLYLQPAQDVQIGNRLSRTQYQYVLQDPDTAELELWAPKLLDRLSTLSAVSDVASDDQKAGLTAHLTIDRDAASRLNVSLQAIDDTLYDALGQRQVSTIYTQLNQYHVILEVAPAHRLGPDALDQLYVRGGDGTLVRMSALATWSAASAPLVLTHVGQFPAVTLSFNLAPGVALGAALEAIKAAEQSIGLPPSIATSFTGDAAEFQKSLGNEILLIGAAIIVVYIVLGVLYESYIHPLTILSTLPSAGVGALLALMLTGHEFGVIALIGLILLIGIVKKNAIMMVDFAILAERERGLAPQAAIREASLLRFRPIMMTTMAALFGALPLALGQGSGAELRQPLGIAIVGGLVVSQALTLFTTPVVYLALGRAPRLFRPRKAGQPTTAAVTDRAVVDV